MARGQNPYFTDGDFVKPEKRFWPLHIPVLHWQLRHFISQPEPHHIYYASKTEVYCLNTVTKKRKLIAILPFDARCTASGYGWVCVGGGNDKGHFAAIKLDGSGDVDAALPINTWRSGRRSPSVKVESIGENIVNSISIHRIQDEEAHLDDIVAVVTNNDSTIRIYSLPLGVETKVLHLPDPMNHATISPCGAMLVAVGDRNEVFFFERELKEKPPLIHKPHNRLTSASLDWKLIDVCDLYINGPDSPRGYFTTAWSPDGQYVAVGSEGCFITLFDIESIRACDSEVDPVVAVIPSSRADCRESYAGSVRSMMFSPAPWDLLIWAEDQGRVCIGDLRSGLQRTQVLHLDPCAEGLEKVLVEDTPTDAATQDEIEQLSQTLQRNLEGIESALARRYGQPSQGSGTLTYPTEYLEARSRQRIQRLDNALRAQQSNQPVADDVRGLSADEQQTLQILRTARQREEARAGGRAPGTNYTTIEALINRSSASSTPNTADSSTRPISDILNSVPESWPELARTIAHSSRPSSAHGPSTQVPTGGYGWNGRWNARPWTPADYTSTQTYPSTDARGHRPRNSVLLSPQEARYEGLVNTHMTTLARAIQLPDVASSVDAEEDQTSWRTIQDAMATAHGTLFESAARAPALPASPTMPQATEVAEIQALARRRTRLRAARASLSNARNIGTLAGTERGTTLSDAYEMMRRSTSSHNREMGVRTAGLAMSRDGSTLWAACEEGIFEFQMNNKGRMFWPAVKPR